MPKRTLSMESAAKLARATERMVPGSFGGRSESAGLDRGKRKGQAANRGSSRRTLLFSGNMVVGVLERWYFTFPGSFVSVRANTDDATISQATYDVLKNGVSIFGATKPIIALGQTLGTTAKPTTTAFAKDDYVEVECEATGGVSWAAVAIEIVRS